MPLVATPVGNVGQDTVTVSATTDGDGSGRRRRALGYAALLATAVVLGSGLRLALVGDQVVLDDEWHSLSFVSDKSFGEPWTQFNRNANAIPTNLYRWGLPRAWG